MAPRSLPLTADIQADPPARLAFYCHGSTSVGLGHVMRSRSVAEAAADEAARRAEARIFAVGDASIEPLLANRRPEFEIHATDEAAAAAIEAYAPDVVYFDMLHTDDAVFARLARGRTTASLSPVFNHLDRVDLFFHRSAVHPRTALRPQRAGWNCGLEYAIVRPGCTPIATARYLESLDPEQPLNVAISMGGGDASNRTLRVLRALRDIPRPMVFWVLLGEAYSHSYLDLVACARRDAIHEIILAKTSESMWRIVRHCAVAVLAAGTVTYEATAAGLPSINTFDDPAHRFLVRELVDRGAAFDAGAPFDAALATVTGLLSELDRDRGRLRAAHEAARGLIDGRGAHRVIAETLRHVAGSPRAASAA